MKREKVVHRGSQFGLYRWLQAVLVTTLVLMVAAGCGGGGASVGGSGMPFAVRTAAMSAAQGLAEDLTPDNFGANAPAVATAIADLPEFESAWVATGTPVIWARFTDGRLLAITASRPPEGGGSSIAARPSRAPAGGLNIPSSGAATFFFSFSEPEYTDAGAILAEKMSDHGYTTITGKSGTLADYRALSDTSFLYVDSHGVIEQNLVGPDDVVIQVGQVIKDTSDQQLAAELNANEVIYISRAVGSKKVHYGITGTWIEKNVRLAPGAFVLLNTCNSMANSTVSDAFRAAGAKAVVGWDKPVGDLDSVESAKYLIDRAMGGVGLYTYSANDPRPEYPETWTQVVDRMRITPRANSLNTMLTRYGKNCEMKIAGEEGYLGSFRPSIRKVTPNVNNRTAILEGVFGTTPGTVRANPESGGGSLAVKSWTSNAIVVDYDATVNALQVTANSVKSNVFEIKTGEYILGSASAGPFTIKTNMTLYVNGISIGSWIGPTVQPIRIRAKSGDLLRIRLTSTEAFGGTSDVFIKPPNAAAYRILANALDLLVNPTTGVVTDRTYTLQ